MARERLLSPLWTYFLLTGFIPDPASTSQFESIAVSERKFQVVNVLIPGAKLEAHFDNCRSPRYVL